MKSRGIRSLGLLILGLGVCAMSASAQMGDVPDTGPKLYSGPSYQYEGKWAATVRSALSDTMIDTVATCANPIILQAVDGQTLARSDGQLIQITPIDSDTNGWTEGGKSTVVTPSAYGNFVALTTTAATGQPDPGRIVSYLRCGTAGQTAADQVCVAN